MKTRFFSILTVSCLMTLSFLTNTFAQDSPQWSLPDGVIGRLGKGELTGGTRGIAFSPSGDNLAVASGIGIWIYDAETIQEHALLAGSTGAVESVSFSPDGTLLASGTWDNIVELWDVATGQNVATLEGRTVSFSRDGTHLASVAWDAIKLWDVATKENIATLIGHTAQVNCVAFSSDGTLLASGAWDNTVKLWDVATGQNIATLKSDSGFVTSVTFSPNGTILAAASFREVKLWDVTTQENIFSFEARTGGRQSLEFSPSGRILAYISTSRVRLWDVATRTNIATLTRRGSYNLFSVAFSPDGAILAAASWDNTVTLWNVETKQNIGTLEGHTSWVTSVAFSPNRTVLAAASWHDVKLWDVVTKQNIAMFARDLVGVSSIAYSPNGEKLVTGEGHPVQVARDLEDGTVDLWDVATQERILVMKSHTNWVYSVAFSNDGQTIASGGGRFGDYDLRLWDAATGRHLKTLTGHTDQVNSVVFSPDGITLASGSNDATMRLWDVGTGQLRNTFTGHTGDVRSVIFSPNGTTLASGSGDDTVRLWDVATGSVLNTLEGHTSWVSSVAFSPDGHTLASGGGREVRLWDVGTGSLRNTLTGHTGSVSSVAFSPDGHTLASGSRDGTILLWRHTPTTPPPSDPSDVNGDGQVTVIDLAIVALFYGTQVPVGISLPADVNADGIVNLLDMTAVAQGIDAVGGVNQLSLHEVKEVLLAAAAQAGDIEAVAEAPMGFGNPRHGIAYRNVAAALADVKLRAAGDARLGKGMVVLEGILQMLAEMGAIPETTMLLPNYPNPFNPETWIPYHLSKDAVVTLTIYDTSGSAVRELLLGHQTAGVYESRGRAVYWDGKNQIGEKVASGLYFYTLTAGDFTATRKLLIRK